MCQPGALLVTGNNGDPRGVRGASRGTGILRLDYLGTASQGANVKLALPDFVRSVVFLPPRALDLLEIAAYVYCADRYTRRGAKDAVEHHAWARSFHFVMRVRDIDFWGQPRVQELMAKALTFMTGDREYRFTFQGGHATPPTSLFNHERFSLEPEKPTHVVLFSGGLDSLAGVVQLLKTTESDVCLVSHQSQPGTIMTQRQLFRALSERFPDRVKHYKFKCNLHKARAAEESQRTRSFLYAAIAYALAQAWSQAGFFVFENGVTAINFPRRQDLTNARASRTTHPQTIGLLSRFFSEVAGMAIDIKMPFLWKTKAETLQVLGEQDAADLISSTVSCSRTFQKEGQGTHCGSCFQCIDRRFGAYAAQLDDVDEAGIYGKNFIVESVEDGEARTTLMDYVRQAGDFARWHVDVFEEELTSDLAELVDFVETCPEHDAVERIWELCRRHGLQVQYAIQRMRQKHDDPYSALPDHSLMRMIAEREHLKTPVDRAINDICKRLDIALPRAFRSQKCSDERALNDAIDAFLTSAYHDMAREHPAVPFALGRAIADHSCLEGQLIIEAKFLRAATTPSKASESMAADLTKYPSEAYILFVVYDPDRSIRDDSSFKRDLQRPGRSTVHIIR